jgi:hypothetical protein
MVWQPGRSTEVMHVVFVLASEFSIEWDKLWMIVSFIFLIVNCAKLNSRKRI